MITVHTKAGSVIRYRNWPAMRDDMNLLDDEPLEAVFVDTGIILKPKSKGIKTMNQQDARDQSFCRGFEKPVDNREKMSELDTTIEEWKEALEVASYVEGHTVAELSTKLKIPESTLRRKLHFLITTGKCTKGVGRRTSTNGRSINVAVYQLVKGEEK